jgi:hypothetical protein
MLLLVALLGLAACGSKPALVRTNTVAVMPEEALFNCPTVDTLPQSATLTDVQVARLIVQLYQNNAICKNSTTALRTFLENAQRTTAQPSN